MNIFFWMDDPTTFNPKKDTTYLLIYEYLKQGHKVFWITDVGIDVNKLRIHGKKIQPFEKNNYITCNNEIEIYSDKKNRRKIFCL